MSTPKEMLKQMYDSQLASQKSQLQTDYENALSDLDDQKAQAQKTTDKNINLTRTEAQKEAVSAAEYYNAAGLSSGAKAQARLSQDNQLLANLTAIRAAQQEADASVEKQRALLAKEYTAAIQQAQADNDLARAQALYEEAKEAEEKLLAKQEAAAGIMAQGGDFSRYGELYGLSDAEIQTLTNIYNGTSNTSSSGSSGGSDSNSGSLNGAANNGNRSTAEIITMQKLLGVTQDGRWGPKTRAAALARWGTADPDAAWEANNAELYAQYQAAHSGRQATATTGSTETQNTSTNSKVSNVFSDLNQLTTLQDKLAYLEDARKSGYLTSAEYLAMKPLIG